MKNLVKIVLLAIGLTGCATSPICNPIIQTKVVTVYVPVSQVPAPPTVTPPALYMATLTPAQKSDIGELAKAYNITVLQLEGYIVELKKVVDQYAQMAANNPPVVNVGGSSAPSSAPVK